MIKVLIKMLLFIAFVLLTSLQCVRTDAGDITIGVGETAQLNCSASGSASVRWDRRTLSAPASVTINTAHPQFASRFNVTFLRHGLSRLVIRAVQSTDSGDYYCFNAANAKLVSTVKLTVTCKENLVHTYIVSLVGTTANFDCRSCSNSRSDVMWKVVSSTAGGSDRTIYNGQQLVAITDDATRPRLNVTSSAGGVSQLLIVDLRLGDAGIYSCMNGGQQALTGSLTVVEQPRCAINFTSNQLKCEVCYAGEVQPSVSCQTDLTGRAKNSAVVAEQLNQTCVTYSETSTSADFLRHHPGFSCFVLFESRQQVLYNYTWLSTRDMIEYGPNSAAIFPTNQTIFQHGDKLHCQADSYPEPVYQWLVNKKVREGPEYAVDICDVMSGGRRSRDPYRVELVSVIAVCVARRNGASASTSVKIDVLFHEEIAKERCAVSGNSMSLALIIGISVVTAVSAVAMTLTAIVIRKRCKRAANETGRTNENSQISDALHYSEIYEQEAGTLPGPTVTPGQGRVPPYVNVDPVNSPTETITDRILTPKSYEELCQETMEPPPPPAVYSRVTRTAPAAL